MREFFDALGRHALAVGGKVAFDDGGSKLTYASLAGRVAATAEALRSLPSTPKAIGIFGGHCVDSVVGLLAGWHAGKTVVPLPPFFAAPQLRHIVEDAGITHILATSELAERVARLGVPVSAIGARETEYAPPAGADGHQIIYTSGSTGRPKGVVLGCGQMMWSATALGTAIEAHDTDSYLSVLPLSLLLETICAVMIPVLAGASVRLDATLVKNFGEAGGDALADLVATHRPTCMVLVPQLLSQWIAAVQAGAAAAPDSLRVVAVGGATVSPALAQQGWDLGIPVCEGYGLSECGSVVSFNRPDERRAGTVGRPLSGLEVAIDRGEIVVRGPTVMERYLHGAPTGGVWHTADVGELDADGYLTVRGRKDNLIVTPLGRNVSPEWIESAIAADPRIAFCVVTHVEGPHLTAILVPSAVGGEWFARAPESEIGDAIAARCADIPAYAVPRQFVVAPPDQVMAAGLITGAGDIRRAETVAAFAGAPASRLAPPSKAETETNRQEAAQ